MSGRSTRIRWEARDRLHRWRRGWYRKHYQLAVLPRGARVEILFEGICLLSDVWLNGTKLGSHVNGYTPFSYELTDHLVREGKQALATCELMDCEEVLR